MVCFDQLGIPSEFSGEYGSFTAFKHSVSNINSNGFEVEWLMYIITQQKKYWRECVTLEYSCWLMSG